jgi:hypothetical protein
MLPKTNKPEKKNGRIRTAAKGKSLMERNLARKAADFKAGVAIKYEGYGDASHSQRKSS